MSNKARNYRALQTIEIMDEIKIKEDELNIQKFETLKYANSLNWAEGVTKHQQTYKVLMRAASLGVKASLAVEIVLKKVLESNGQVDMAGIYRQCRRAFEFVIGKSTASLPRNAIALADGSYAKPKPIEFSFEKLKQKTAPFKGCISREWFLQRSPKRPKSAHEFLRELYSADESVAILTNCRQRKPALIWNHDQSEFGQLSSEEGIFFLPNPVTGRRHLVNRLKSETNPTGETWRSAEAVTDWRYMLLESDLGENEFPGVRMEWLKLLALLKAPIVSIVGSGGKSFHALVRVNALTKDDWDQKVYPLKEPLRELGADPGALSAVRLTRMPFCLRNGILQDFYYCDPSATNAPIAQNGGEFK